MQGVRAPRGPPPLLCSIPLGPGGFQDLGRVTLAVPLEASDRSAMRGPCLPELVSIAVIAIISCILIAATRSCCIIHAFTIIPFRPLHRITMNGLTVTWSVQLGPVLRDVHRAIQGVP